MDIIAWAEDAGFAIGWLKDTLVYSDGKSYREINLRESAQAFSDVIKTGAWTGDDEAQAKWFALVGKE